MPKVVANGKTFNFPEGTSQQEIGEAIDNYFKTEPTAAEPQTVDPVRQELAGKIKPEIKVPDIPMPFGMQRSDIEQANRGRADYNKLVESLLTDPNALAAYKQAQSEGTLPAIAGAAGSELTAMSEGVGQLIDQYLPESISNILNYQIGGENFATPEERMDARAIRMAKENLEKGARSVASPVASTVGATIPYLASEVALSPVTNAILSNVGKGITTVGKGALRTGEALETGLKGGRSIASQQAGDLIAPAVSQMRNIAARPPLSPELTASYKELARAPLTGAIEGAMHYNMTPEEGMLQSTVGQAFAMGPVKSMLGQMPSKLSKSEQQTLKTMVDRGYRATPGMKTGSKYLQAKEQGFRSEPRFRDYMDEYDTANQKVIADYASEAMGLPKQRAADITPEVLNNHMLDLSRQYQALEANTTGKFSQDSFKRINGILKNRQPIKDRNQSVAARQDYATLQDAVAEMRTVLQPFTTREGKFAVQKFDGSKYQAASQYLNDQIASAFQNGRKGLARDLKAIKGELDKSIESGMGKTTAKEWRDLNERYAMSRIVMDTGMDPLGGINTSGLTNYLMSGDEALRTLTGRGGRIKKLQDIARIDTMQKRQAGAEGWSGSGVEQGDTSKQGLMKSTFRTPLVTRIPMSTRAGMNLYMSGWPATGLLPISRPNIGKLSRAQEQGSQNISELSRDIQDMYADQLSPIWQRIKPSNW